MEHFAWPTAAVVFGVFFIVLFRTEIAGFLAKVKKVGRDGISTTLPSGQKSIEQQAEAPPSKEVQDLLQSFDSPALLQQERVLFADLENRKLDSTSDTTKVLVRYLAKTRLVLFCEYVYRLIFGSQIMLLKRINTQRGCMPEGEAHQFYEAVARTHPDTFVAGKPGPYFDFLIRQGLLLHQDEQYLITDHGREFLIWLIQSGSPENKGL